MADEILDGMMHPDRTTDDRYGAHTSWNTPCNGFWLKDFDFKANPEDHASQHSILDRCSTPFAQSGQNLDDMVWYNHGTKAFQRVKGAQRIV